MNNILPNGTELRDLLSNSFLTNSHINKLLREKGIITQNSDKNATFPIYMSLLLSPNEFNYLYEKNTEKEEKKKITNAIIPIDENIPLVDLCLELNIHDILDKKLTYKPNFEVVGNPSLTINDDEINLDLQIKSTSNIKGWSSRESLHNASLNLKKDNDRLIVTKTFTSKDSEKVLTFALENYEEKLASNKYLKKDVKVSRVLFNDFSNENRIAYFYSFTRDFKNIMTFEEITDIDVLPDYNDTSKVSDSLKNFLDNVDNINLKGKELQKHIFMTEKENHEFIKLRAIKFKYNFDKLGCEGSCIVEFEFPDKRNMDTSEFQFNIANLNISKHDRDKVSHSSITKKISGVLIKHKLENYDAYKLKEEAIVDVQF